MARPARSVNVISKNMAKEEREKRQKVEEKVRGGTEKLKPPSHLNKNQRKIFRYILEELDESKLLGNLDLYILEGAVVAIDKMEQLDKQLNGDPTAIYDSSFRSARRDIQNQCMKYYSELCLSPQSRAKIAISAASPDKDKKTLLDLINEEDDDE